jgi:hypothetical protein
MIEYFNQDKYNILYIPAVERDGTPLNERCIKPRPFKKIPLTGSVEHKIMALCHEIDLFQWISIISNKICIMVHVDI